MTEEHPVVSHDDPIHVLDLPQLYTHPSATILFDTLSKLAIKPRSWSSETEGSNRGPEAIDEDGIPQYLTSIISSRLRWIEDEDVREQVWEMASSRLSERSGRTAQPTQTRTFTIPLPLPFHNPLEPSTSNPHPNPLQITLHEPTLTADNLGHKTWLSSYLLARRLPILLSSYLLPNSPPPPPHSQSHAQIPLPFPRVLELGSGTGLLGLTAAAVLPQAQIHLTDLEPIIGNLAENVRLNAALYTAGKFPEVGVLDWSAPPPSFTRTRSDAAGSEEMHSFKSSNPKSSPSSSPQEKENKKAEGLYDLILASDPLYSLSHPAWLVQTVLRLLARPTYLPPILISTPTPTKLETEIETETKAAAARLIIELPLREAYLPQVEEMRARLREGGLELLDEGVEVGSEDWDGGASEVTCWWGVWGWAA